MKKKSSRERYGVTANILSDVRVLDLSRVLAGPYTSRILADFGADVIKVQSKQTATGAETNTSDYFRYWNRNKRSITLNMNYDEGRQLLLQLIKMCDVLIENFSPRVLSNWGLSYERLKRINSSIIMLQMSAMGQTGPWKNHTAFGPTIQSFAGMTYLTADDVKAPVGPGNSFADMVSGLYGAVAVMGALYFRDHTGCGQYIDLSEYEAMVSMLGPHLLDTFVNGKKIIPSGNSADHIQAAPYGCYSCHGEDQWCVIAVCNEEQWQGFCNALDNPSWTKKAYFTSLPTRMENRQELDDYIKAWTIQLKTEAVVQLLQEHGVPSGPVQNAEALANDPQLAARDFFSRFTPHGENQMVFDTYPFTFSCLKSSPGKPAPALGEDNKYVYKKILRLSEEKYLSYVNQGIIG